MTYVVDSIRPICAAMKDTFPLIAQLLASTLLPKILNPASVTIRPPTEVHCG